MSVGATVTALTSETASDVGASIWGAIAGGGEASRRETTSEIQATYAGQWGSLSTDCSTRDAAALAIALGEVYERNPAASRAAYTRAQSFGYRPGEVGEREPQNPTERARVIVWLACNGWDGAGSGLRQAEKWAQGEVRQQLTSEIPEVSKLPVNQRSTVDQIASFLREKADQFDQAAAGLSGAEQGAKAGVTTERVKQAGADLGIETKDVLTGVTVAGIVWGLGKFVF